MSDSIPSFLCALLDDVFIPSVQIQHCSYGECTHRALPHPELEGSYCAKHEALVLKALRQYEEAG